MKKVYHIQISEQFQFPSQMELFSILEQLLPFKFFLRKQIGIKADGALIIEKRTNKAEGSIPTLSLPSPPGSAYKKQQIETEVKFADDPDVPFPFRGRTVSTKLAQIGSFLSVHSDEKILATSMWGPIWLVSQIDGIKHYRSCFPLPHISVKENLSDAFNGECFLEVLVLLHFIREISTNTAYQYPPLRAGFIIDDPNLHWPNYGFVNYRELVAHAKKENYHVSFATIPLDTWFTHASTADLFRMNSQWISLLIHGNNHAKRELVLNYSGSMRQSILHQAIERIKRLENKSNLQICRVMVPPHGACSDEMLAELPKCGFESACISAGSLRFHNLDKPWTKILGFYPAEIIQGCPVLPRWGLTGNVKNTILLAAYLGQPIILRGHHQDLKDGVEVFDELAQFINGLGNVFWSSLTDLSRLNYLWQIQGTTCLIKPLGIKVSFELPNEATEITIENPSEYKDCTWQAISTDGRINKLISGERLLLSEEMGHKISLERNTTNPKTLHVNTTSIKSTNSALILRRLLTEVRDRLLIY